MLAAAANRQGVPPRKLPSRSTRPAGAQRQTVRPVRGGTRAGCPQDNDNASNDNAADRTDAELQAVLERMRAASQAELERMRAASQAELEQIRAASQAELEQIRAETARAQLVRCFLFVGLFASILLTSDPDSLLSKLGQSVLVKVLPGR
jgi:hypothetical protein